MPNTYTAFGLKIRSEIELPMAPATFEQADMAIVLGATPNRLDAPLDQGLRFQVSQSEFLMQVDGVARFWVRSGSCITIEALNRSTSIQESLVFLLGSALAAALHQRQATVLHACAVTKDGKAVALLGHSGSGKSTTASFLSQAGYQILSDDLAAIRFDGKHGPIVEPGYQRAKLWPDSMEALGIPFAHLPRVRNGIEKRYYNPANAFANTAHPLEKIFVLSPSTESDITFRSLKPAEALQLIRLHTFRNRFLVGKKPRQAAFLRNTELARRVPCTHARHGPNPGSCSNAINDFGSALLERLQA